MKLKKVIIDGFRAYESADNGTFDFTTPSGQCADFVTIFAPNGFGKTSFYDAVEYALTGNISRFVRDAHRSNYDSKSRTQLQRERKQYILRNHSIPPSATAKIDVLLEIDGKEHLERKTIPKPKTGRDFFFTSAGNDSKYPGMRDVFLSQEAIDAFLREERPDARYVRFMSNFGDSDEVYRSNLETLKRELEATLQETQAQERQLREIAERPVNREIFTVINRTIESLSIDQEVISPIGERFVADDERQLRNHVTQRVHDLETLRARLQSSIAALSQLAAQQSGIASAVERKLGAQREISAIASLRAEYGVRTSMVQTLAGLQTLITESNRWSERLSETLALAPAFDDLQATREMALATKLKNGQELDILRVELAKLAQREGECGRRAEIVEAEIQRLLALQRDCPSTYLQIDAKRELAQVKERERSQQKQLLESLTARLTLSRQEFGKVRSIAVGPDFADAPELTLIASDEFSPIALRAAIVEVKAKRALFDESSRALDAVQLHTSQIADLVAAGRALLGELHSPKCPLCSHNHGSYEALLDVVLNNDALTDREQTALREKHKAEAALTEATAVLDRLLQGWEVAKAKRIDALRENIQIDERDLTQKEEIVRQLEGELQGLHAELVKLQADVLNLPLAQFLEKLTGDITSQNARRDAELKEKVECKQQLDLLVAREKDLLQLVEAEQAKVNIIESDVRYQTTIAFCQTHRIDAKAVRDFIAQRTDEVRQKLVDLDLQFRATSKLLSDIDTRLPSLQQWDANEASVSETRAQEVLLAADALIVPFESSCEQQLAGYEKSWSMSEVENSVAASLSSARQKIELHDRILQNYTLLGQQLTDVRPYLESIDAQTALNDVIVKRGKEDALAAALNSEYESVSQNLDRKIQSFFYPNLINSIYRRIDPHPDFKRVEFSPSFEEDKPTLEVFVADADGDLISPDLFFSAAQVNILSLSIFLARALHAKNGEHDVKCIFIDDPIHSMDSINVLATIDLLRSISLRFDRQIILSTHDRNFFELLQRKLPSAQYNSKFLELETFGKVVAVP
ncbi:AAA family ATPase [Paraburkholderia phymatum]|uniref:AAA family ATPase n=1 Tax=Paraburkholderia phymatum TaxID=148447 RepID=A0ACC6U9E8_9BURK